MKKPTKEQDIKSFARLTACGWDKCAHRCYYSAREKVLEIGYRRGENYDLDEVHALTMLYIREASRILGAEK